MMAATAIYIPICLDYKVMRLSTDPNKKISCLSERREGALCTACMRLWAVQITLPSLLCLTIIHSALEGIDQVSRYLR